MDRKSTYTHIHFQRRVRVLPFRIVFLIVTLLLFAIIWLAVPPSGAVWLLLILVSLLGWTASFGWRLALATLHRFLEPFDTH